MRVTQAIRHSLANIRTFEIYINLKKNEQTNGQTDGKIGYRYEIEILRKFCYMVTAIVNNIDNARKESETTPGINKVDNHKKVYRKIYKKGRTG